MDDTQSHLDCTARGFNALPEEGNPYMVGEGLGPSAAQS